MISIYIPTRGRPNVATLNSLTPELREHTTLVVRKDEESLYRPTADKYGTKLMTLPPGTEGISPTRQFIIENCDEIMCMLDDDFTSFGIKHDMSSISITKATEDEINAAFEDLTDTLTNKGYHHAGFYDRPRCGLHTGERYRENKMMMQVLGYRASTVRKLGPKFTDVRLAQDKHMTLALLERGFKNLLFTYFTFNCYGTQAKGGCSLFRTEQMINDQALLLRDLHQECVTITPKTVNYRGIDSVVNKVRISWSTAYGLMSRATCV